MRSYEKLSRKYKYRMKQKYQEDPFAFLVLWSLFFSAIFLIFAFRGLIAATFMHKIDVSNEAIQNEVNNTTDNTLDNQTNPPAGSDETPANTSDNTPVDNSTNETQNTLQ